MPHQCPAPKCPVTTVADGALACRTHWWKIPEPLRHAVNQAWDQGRGKFTPAHRRAMAEAVRWLKDNA